MSKPFDSERETRVLLEEVRFELKVVAEGHTSVVRRLDKVEDGLQEVKGGLQEVKGRLIKVEGRLDRVEGRLGKVEGRLGRVEGQLDQLQDQVGSVLTDHEFRIKTVEQKFEIT